MVESDDEFLSSIAPRKNKLSKKKSKNKENVLKPHTSTQYDEPQLSTSNEIKICIIVKMILITFLCR